MTTIFVVCGKVNYTNLSRYSDYRSAPTVGTLSRALALRDPQSSLIEHVRRPERAQIVVVDCTFLEKSGRHTYGLDWFYNGKTQRAEKGLELSVVAIVDVEQNTGYTLSAQQTEAGLSRPAATTVETTTAQGNRIEFYLGHLAYCMITSRPGFAMSSPMASTANTSGSLASCNSGFMPLANSAVMPTSSFSMTVPIRAEAHDAYDGKVNLQRPPSFQLVERLEDGVYLYTAVVWSVSLKRKGALSLSAERGPGTSQLCGAVFHRPRN
jgi:hypothetical protein